MIFLSFILTISIATIFNLFLLSYHCTVHGFTSLSHFTAKHSLASNEDEQLNVAFVTGNQMKVKEIELILSAMGRSLIFR